MTLNQLFKLIPPEYSKFKDGKGRGRAFYMRNSEQSCVVITAEKTTKKQFLPETHDAKDLGSLYYAESPSCCLVDFKDVAVGDVLCRFQITRTLEGNLAKYLLSMDIYHGGAAIRLFAAGDEQGNSFLRRSEPEESYKKIASEAPFVGKATTRFNFIDRMPREGWECCYVIGEDCFYDEMYPEHPLSQLRILARTLVHNCATKDVA